MKIKEGMLVRYRREWCGDGERKYIHLVLENRLNPCTGEMTRWLIRTLNSNSVLGYTETVDDYMIEPIPLEEFLDMSKGEEMMVCTSME